MYSVDYELLETDKIVYMYISQDSIGKSEEEIDIPAVSGLRSSDKIHEECVWRWFALLHITKFNIPKLQSITNNSAIMPQPLYQHVVTELQLLLYMKPFGYSKLANIKLQTSPKTIQEIYFTMVMRVT
jgi:hypothetical protein